jgi:hypothetical protein
MSKPGPVVLLSPDGRRSGSGGRTSREVEYLRHYVLPAGHACLSHRYRRFAGFRYRQLGADARILTDIFRLAVRGPDRADWDPRRGRQHCLACALMAGPPPKRSPQTAEASTSVRRVRVVRSGVVGPASRRALQRPIEREVGDFLPSIDGGKQVWAVELHDLRDRL